MVCSISLRDGEDAFAFTLSYPICTCNVSQNGLGRRWPTFRHRWVARRVGTVSEPSSTLFPKRSTCVLTAGAKHYPIVSALK